MPILTLTTDWGLRDHYVASFKGEVLSLIPSLQVIDISNEVEKFNIMQAAYIIQNAYKKFPPGSIHFIGISGNENSLVENPFLIVRTNGHYLFGEDNGIFSLITGDDAKEIVRLPLIANSDRKEVYKSILETLKKLAEGVNFLKLGTPEETIKESYFALPTVDGKTIRGTIIYIDAFGNVMVNVTRYLFDQERRNRKFIIYLRKSEYNVDRISNTYEEVIPGEMLALFNQDGFLEIALNKNSASQLLGLKLMDPIRIEFDADQAG